MNTKQYCYAGNTAKQCRLELFQDSDFAGDLEGSKSTSGGVLCMFGSRTFSTNQLDVQKGKTSVSHSSTELEVVSLDAGWRMDGLLALDLWDLVYGTAENDSRSTQTKPSQLLGNRWHPQKA